MLEYFNNDRTLYWIAIDIANNAGHDKMLFPQRVQFVVENLSILKKFYEETRDPQFFDIILDKLCEHEQFSGMDSPLQFTNAVNALFEYLQTGYTNHMVYLDASNQALQLYAILTRDKRTASTCNIANGDQMADAYQMLANSLNDILGTTFSRKNCKFGLMTKMYGKMDAYQEILDDRYSWTDDRSGELEREFGVNMEEFEDAFNRALISIAPKAVSAMQSIQMLNNEHIGTYYWTLPDGFNVKYDVKMDTEVEFQDTTKHGYVYCDTFQTELFRPDKYNQGMAPNVIHSVDGYVVRQMKRRLDGRFMTSIHDAYGAHPQDCDDLVQNYKDICCELLDSTILSDILSEISGTTMSFNYSNTLTCADIQNSTYLLG